jgi:hypothetical protein
VRLITAHRILIGSGIVFFLFYAGWRVRHYVNGGPPSDVVQSLVAVAVAVALILYFRSLRRWGPPRS